MNKVSIIGIGRVGSSSAYALLFLGLVDELVLYARDKNKALGEKLDLEHSLPFLEPVNITATDNFADLRDSDVVVITAGVSQKSDQTRLDLVSENKKIIESLIPQIVIHAPKAVVLIISNPVDILTYHAAQIAQLNPGQIFSSGTMLDTARFRFHLAQSLNLNPRSIHAYILGEHGDTSFPVLSSATVGGQPLSKLKKFSETQAQNIFKDVQKAAQNIISTKGATYYAIGVVVSQLVKTILQNSRSVLPVSVPLSHYYGIDDVALSVPCIVGRRGVEQILIPQLSSTEQTALRHSADTLKKIINQPAPLPPQN